MEDNTGVCKLCEQQKHLINAHILPKSFYLLKSNKKLMSIDNNGNKDWKHYQNGIKDKNILCGDCDRKLGIYDKYAKEILFDIIPQKRHFDTSLFLLNGTEFDYEKLRKFFISLVWRASISTEVNNIKLGKYEDMQKIF